MKEEVKAAFTEDQLSAIQIFKGCTGISDQNILVYFLKQADWNVEMANENYMNEQANSEVFKANSNYSSASKYHDWELESNYLANNSHLFTGNSQYSFWKSKVSKKDEGKLKNEVHKAIEKFKNNKLENYTSKFGEAYTKKLKDIYSSLNFPNFAMFTLQEAFRETQFLQRPLALVIDDFSQNNSNFFFETISNEVAINLLNSEFVNYFCDSSSPEGINMISYLNIKNSPLILIFKRTNTAEPFLLFSNPVNTQEFLTSLYELSVNYKPQISELAMDKENYDNNDSFSEENELSKSNDLDISHKSSTEKIRKNIEEEFKNALLMDQLNEKLKKEAMDKKIVDEKEKEKEKEKIIEEEDKNDGKVKQINEEELMKIKQENLPQEMNQENPYSTKIIIRYPSGKKIEKLWSKKTTIHQIYNFIDVTNNENLKSDSYILVQTSPKKDFSADKTLEEEGLFPGGIINIVLK